MLPSQLPNPRARFRPRLDGPLLSRLVQDAWGAHQAAAFPPEDIARVGEALARHLEGLYPLADMRILAVYGLARAVDRINVSIHNGRDWSETAGVELGRKVPVAENFRGLWCGGPRYGGDTAEGMGFKPDAWAALTPEQKAEVVEGQDDSLRRRVPLLLEPHFAAVLVLRAAYRTEHKSSMDWPMEEKARAGVYPTWAAIAERWPVLGTHLLRLWGRAGLSAAA